MNCMADDRNVQMLHEDMAVATFPRASKVPHPKRSMTCSLHMLESTEIESLRPFFVARILYDAAKN